MFSNRTAWNLARNRLAEATAEARRAGRLRFDLTGSNPTQAGFEYPAEAIADAIAQAARNPSYDPDPKGDREAREAIARRHAGQRGGTVPDPETIVLTPGTSEAYGWLFKLLCDPGERVLAPRPSYPLFEFLAGLESVVIEPYPLAYEGRWSLEAASLERALGPGPSPDDDLLSCRDETLTPPARALVLVEPNNPTGSVLSSAEHAMVRAFARRHDLALISDEVFRSFPLGSPGMADSSASTATSESRAAPESACDIQPPQGLADQTAGIAYPPADAPPLRFVLDGLSKSAGLPGLKVGWIVVEGPDADRAEALARLEVIADTYLPLASPLQRAIPRLIELGEPIAAQIHGRIRANDDLLRRTIGPGSPCAALRGEGGWTAVVRVPRRQSEEDLVLSLLDEDGVLVQPGWLYDFETEAYVIVSLLTPERVFAEGIRRLLARAD